MNSPQQRDSTEYFESQREAIALGLAYVVVGLTIMYSVFAELVTLFMAAALGMIFLLVLSLIIMIQAEGLVTTENKVIGCCVLVAMALLGVLSAATTLSSEIIFAIVFGVGFILPTLVLQYSNVGPS